MMVTGHMLRWSPTATSTCSMTTMPTFAHPNLSSDSDTNMHQADKLPAANVWDFLDIHAIIESDSEYEDESDIADDLRYWATRYQIKYSAVDDLLKILNKHGHIVIFHSQHVHY